MPKFAQPNQPDSTEIIEQVDLFVVGTGVGGLSALTEAQQCGMTTAAFDKRNRYLRPQTIIPKQPLRAYLKRLIPTDHQPKSLKTIQLKDLECLLLSTLRTPHLFRGEERYALDLTRIKSKRITVHDRTTGRVTVFGFRHLIIACGSYRPDSPIFQALNAAGYDFNHQRQRFQPLYRHHTVLQLRMETPHGQEHLAELDRPDTPKQFKRLQRMDPTLPFPPCILGAFQEIKKGSPHENSVIKYNFSDSSLNPISLTPQRFLKAVGTKKQMKLLKIKPSIKGGEKKDKLRCSSFTIQLLRAERPSIDNVYLMGLLKSKANFD